MHLIPEHDVVLRTIPIINAATKGEAGICRAIWTVPVPRGQPNGRSHIHMVKKIVDELVRVWRLMAHGPALSTIPVKVDPAMRRIWKPIVDDVVIGGAIDGEQFTAGGSHITTFIFMKYGRTRPPK
jgi:hypothetical protein